MKIYNLKVLLEPSEDGGFFIECPSLQGCYTSGKTRGQALKNIREAIDAHLAGRFANGETLPTGLKLTEDEYDNLICESRIKEEPTPLEEVKARIRSQRPTSGSSGLQRGVPLPSTRECRAFKVFPFCTLHSAFCTLHSALFTSSSSPYPSPSQASPENPSYSAVPLTPCDAAPSV